METVIRLALENFTLTVLILGFAAAFVALALGRRGGPERVPEAFLAYYLLFSIFVSFFYNFVMHVFFGAMTARFIGWEDSPFQAEVGFASLGFAVVGLLAFRGSAGMRLAAILGPAFFLWGAAGGHVYQMVTAGNFAPGNAGVIFYTDIFTPLIGLGLYAWRHGALRPAASRGRAVAA
ncbi:DUF6790 family protein [Propylenella binzhouense]|uniref:Uncharacterized protein n=1 Tax=Propylenella binzhouense TaxID=2555902 RepID=A0A964WS35_9HYPH|nr:DUF6790 family protein [Propylenella binzhouense]MYZ46446.1 hypothetical protein [Propylenella binzhouense]